MIVSSSRPWPRIVAEGLREIAPPVAGDTALRSAPSVTVAAAISACMQPPRAAGPPPPWLYIHQVETWRRAVAAVNAHGGALIVESVGRGKTWIALAVAAEFSGMVAVVAPAILELQWRSAAVATGVAIHFHSHERLSRGAVPADAGLVIIDEVHRFRTAATRRATTLAPWLVGRRIVGCTATPIVNADADLLGVLDLFFPDDVLALHGMASVAALAGAASPPLALDRIVIRTVRTEPEWRSEGGVIAPSALEDARAMRGFAAIDRLRLSRQVMVARLIRITLLDALASSDAALLAALRRYGALLAHAADAHGASRRMLRRYAGPTLEQTALWSLLDGDNDDVDLAPDDVATVAEILRELRPADQSWIPVLQNLLLDDLPTICFTRHRATAMAVRHALDGPVAWISGDAAGVGATRLPRAQVLAAFGPGRPAWALLRRTPNVLVATDVAAEGLDLQGAGRVVHLDLPWTAMRMAQREGRLTRIGQRHESVVVVTRLPAAVVEERLAMHRRVRRKHTGARQWLDALQRGDKPGSVMPCGPAPACRIRTRGANVNVIAIQAECGARAGTFVLCGRDGRWEVAGSGLESLLDRARAAPLGYLQDSECGTIMLDALSAAQRLLADSSPRSPTLVRRLHAEAARARRSRDADRLSAVDRVLRFVANRQNRGGRDLMRHIESLPRLDVAILTVPHQRSGEHLRLRVVAALVFRSDELSLR
ncbi:MAG: helicase-related protein [Gemmatimonadales bacterium]